MANKDNCSCEVEPTESGQAVCAVASSVFGAQRMVSSRSLTLSPDYWTGFCLDLIVVVLLFFLLGGRKYLTFVFFYFNGNSEL